MGSISFGQHAENLQQKSALLRCLETLDQQT